MRVSYVSTVTGKRMNVQVNRGIWLIFRETLEITCGRSALADRRLSVGYWITAFDREYSIWAKGDAPTFSAYISKRLTDEIFMDLAAIAGDQKHA